MLKTQKTFKGLLRMLKMKKREKMIQKLIQTMNRPKLSVSKLITPELRVQANQIKRQRKETLTYSIAKE